MDQGDLDHREVEACEMPENSGNEIREAILHAAEVGLQNREEWESVLGTIARDEDQLARLKSKFAADDDVTTWTTTILTTTTIDCTMTTTTTTFTKICGEGLDPGEIVERAQRS